MHQPRHQIVGDTHQTLETIIQPCPQSLWHAEHPNLSGISHGQDSPLDLESETTITSHTEITVNNK